MLLTLDFYKSLSTYEPLKMQYPIFIKYNITYQFEFELATFGKGWYSLTPHTHSPQLTLSHSRLSSALVGKSNNSSTLNSKPQNNTPKISNRKLSCILWIVFLLRILLGPTVIIWYTFLKMQTIANRIQFLSFLISTIWFIYLSTP